MSSLVSEVQETVSCLVSIITVNVQFSHGLTLVTQHFLNLASSTQDVTRPYSQNILSQDPPPVRAVRRWHVRETRIILWASGKTLTVKDLVKRCVEILMMTVSSTHGLIKLTKFSPTTAFSSRAVTR